MTFKKLIAALSVAAALTLAAVSAHASDSPDMTITDVRFGRDGGLFINAGSNGWYWGSATADGALCPLTTVDTRKAWLSIAQASILSGKKLHVVYDTCSSGNRGIREMWLLN